MSNKKKNISNKNYWKIIISSITLILIATLVYFFHDTARFNDVKFSGLHGKKDSLNSLKKSKVVITKFRMGFGTDDTLGLVLASPYANSKQQSQLWKYETQIKNDFILQANQEKIKEWVKTKNFLEIKTTFRNIVNKYLDEPVPEVYISSFFYE